MKIFGQLVRTAVNVVVAPVAMARDAVTLGGALDRDDGKSHMATHLEKLKREAGES